MAEIVLGFASSHGPTMNTPPEEWLELGKTDLDDVRYDFQAALDNAKPGMADELTSEKFQERYDAVQAGIRVVSDVLHEAAPDVVAVFSNPHGGVAPDRMQPTFGIHLNDPPPLTRASGAQPEPDPAKGGGDKNEYPTDGDLARHLMEGLIEEGFDVAASFQSRPGAGLDSAYNLLYQQFDRDVSMPYLPILVSRYLPNQATPRRAYQFGQAVRRVIERWDSPKRVAIMGSGGLSHQIIDEELDRSVIAALEQGDTEALFAIDRQRLNAAPGTPEILNWLACAGAMAPATMTLIDYVPCYRSMAGTGHGNTFGYWR